MEILVCIKRVPFTGAKIVLTEDAQKIDTRNLGFTISPHEECAVEEAVQIVERLGGNASALTLGPSEATEQLRASLAMGINEAILLETDGEDWGPISTANAIAQAVQAELARGKSYDMLLFGNESADSGGYQVGVRVAQALGMPCVTGIKNLEIQGDTAIAKRETADGWEIYQVPLPAVITVKEGINLPRYPSMRGKLQAKKKEIQSVKPPSTEEGLKKIRLKNPDRQDTQAQVLGEGPGAASKALEILKDLGVV
jgi:electron transfer flavoprotein beta subunit